MKLVTYMSNGTALPGALQPDGTVVDLSTVASSIAELVALGRAGLDASSGLIVSGATITPDRLLAPIRPRNNIMAVGRNYHDHAQEFSDSGFDASEVKVIPDFPIISRRHCLRSSALAMPSTFPMIPPVPATTRANWESSLDRAGHRSRNRTHGTTYTDTQSSTT